VAAALIGVGLVVAPFAFSMFERGPKGAEMLDEFRPFMTEERIEGFQDHIALIDAAVTEADEGVRPFLADEAGVDDAAFDDQFATFTTFADAWPAIHADMDDLLTTVHGDIGKYEAVDALPPFDVFPWFFVLPGAAIAVLAVVTLRRSSRSLAFVLAGFGVALVLAPAVFGMFTRAPKGGEMMADFAGFMVRERVQDIQGYFGTMAVGQGGIRLGLVPALADAGLSEAEIADQFPAIADLDGGWVGIINDMTPMIGAMSDNVDNYDAVAALPPFPLFPWFFVVPGLLVAGLALLATRRPSAPTDPLPVEPARSAELPERNPVMSSRSLVTAPLLAIVLLVAACSGHDGGDDSAAVDTTTATETSDATTETTAAPTSGDLVGTFAIDAGACDGEVIDQGSYLQMILPGGTVDAGPYFENPDTTCGDPAYTLIEPGTDGGLVVGDYQPAPDPAFDGTGNSLAGGVVAPTGFTAIDFSISSNPTDPQTGEDVPAPTISFDGDELTGDLSAVTASWNNEWFNQGSPKPDGSAPGLTSPVSGTYDAETGAFTLEWASQIVGGPFNDFTGVWHLEGTFEAAG
jgi:hypothetical protein